MAEAGQNPEDAIKQNTIVIVMEVAAKLEPVKDYKKTHIVSPTMRRTKL